MTLIHIAARIQPQPLQSYLSDDFGNLCHLCACGGDYAVAAALCDVSAGLMTHAKRVLGE